MCFNSNCPTVWAEKSKIGFSKWPLWWPFGFPTSMISAIFHLHVNLSLHCKFQPNSPCGLWDVQNRFSIWWLWWPSLISYWHDFSSFLSKVVLLLHSKFLLKSTKGLGRDVKNWFSRWWLWQSAWVFDPLINFSYFVSTRRPHAPHQVSMQLDHSL